MRLIVKRIDARPTEEGTMFPIFRDWDSVIPGYSPKMVYATTLKPGFSKGPILHEKRSGYLTAIGGSTIVEYFDGSSIKEEILSDNLGNCFVVMIPPGTPVRFRNDSIENETVIINLPDIAWHPDNQDTEKFLDWESCLAHVKK